MTTKSMPSPIKGKIHRFVANSSEEAINDMAFARWDDVLCDALYGACGVRSKESMRTARFVASQFAKEALKISLT